MDLEDKQITNKSSDYIAVLQDDTKTSKMACKASTSGDKSDCITLETRVRILCFLAIIGYCIFATRINYEDQRNLLHPGVGVNSLMFYPLNHSSPETTAICNVSLALVNADMQVPVISYDSVEVSLRYNGRIVTTGNVDSFSVDKGTWSNVDVVLSPSEMQTTNAIIEDLKNNREPNLGIEMLAYVSFDAGDGKFKHAWVRAKCDDVVIATWSSTSVGQVYGGLRWCNVLQ